MPKVYIDGHVWETLREFTGISSPYETPENPDIHVNTNKSSISECAALLFEEISIRLEL